MKINFKGHSPTNREVEITKEDLASLFTIMCDTFLTHIEYGNFKSPHPLKDERNIIDLCTKYGVDYRYTPDRLAFISSILDRLENPYVQND